MGRLTFLSLGCALASLTSGVAPALAGTVQTSASLTLLAPSALVASQNSVTGAVTVPLIQNIGASAGAGVAAMPLPTGTATLGVVKINNQSLGTSIAQVVSRATQRQASFVIVGDRDQMVSVVVPASIALSRLGGEGQVQFSPVTSLTGMSSGRDRLAGAADGTGELAFQVGGRVEPASSATAGDYAGVLPVTIQYN